MMRIKVVVPILPKPGARELRQKQFQAMARPDTKIEVTYIEKGPASIEGEYDDVLAIPDTLKKVKEAEEEGFDAVIINCFGDPGVSAARELVNIPVIGPSQANALLATVVSEKFSIVTVLDDIIPFLEKSIRTNGFISRLASIRSVEIPVLELEEKYDEALNKMTEAAKYAIEEDGAQSILLGCLGMIGMAEEIQSRLNEKGFIVPVLDPAKTALKLAEVAADLKLFNSRKAYPSPREKERRM